ncbi:MAG: ATP synthase F0 subunit B [Spirochaetaceae bacterium]|jgi:F-type H+-transporting ATPase subunit b|nr:ATP synthase F0 subunit B [Spirochaetaceae bacterium]
MLDPSIATFLITLINVGILFAVLRAVLFKRVTQFMEDRSNRIRENIEGAEKDKQTAQAFLAQCEERLKNVQAEADEVLKTAREQAQQEADRIIAQGAAEAKSLVEKARKQIEADQKARTARFQAEAAGLVLAAAGRLLQRELTQEDNRRFAGLLLQELGKS